VQGADDAVTAHAALIESAQGMGAAVFDSEVLIPKATDDDSDTVYIEGREAFLLDIPGFCNGSKELLRHHANPCKKKREF
jgi:hypothetical protein